MYAVLSLVTGNVIGWRATQEEAPQVVRGAIDEFGPTWAADFCLLTDQEGESELGAEGAELVAFAMTVEAPSVA